MTKILVTGAGAVLGQGILKSLAQAGDRYSVHSFDPNPLSVGLHWTNHAGLLPMANDESYATRVEQALDQVRPAAVLVGTDVELGIFAERRDEWETRYNTHILVSSPDVIEIADDKFRTGAWLRNEGLPYPVTALADDRDGVERLVESCGFPLILKPRRGARSVGVHLVHDRAGLEAAIAPGTDQIVQQYAGPEEEEYTAGVLYFDGAVKAQIVLRRDLRDGNTYRAYSGDFPDCEDYVRRVGEALKPYGPANFQFRRHASGEFKLFEINARFSGTTPMRALLGFNEVDMALCHLLDGQPVEQPEVADGIVLRYLEEQLVTNDAVERLRATG
ncbi:ATP-grasp domain-containing protein [Qipengyuania sp. XHP0211]|uniref:ATP-grasp domain-containing protein n=1 Tax=Qipengyuania sp. XHP0211 TaxID=3038079 RepID=UPI00241D03F2|nr:ATP-grasp domain-containing protein [Qipengyuania sp. XHP0211]MDG5750408.1 ATP-grasp domain-containing protein [Qipengyuania sp. XHP0211]